MIKNMIQGVKDWNGDLSSRYISQRATIKQIKLIKPKMTNGNILE